jgi:hypothetical protein
MKHVITVYDQIISDVVQKNAKVVFAYPPEKIWNQKGVSLRHRIAYDAALKGRVDKALKLENLDKYVVAADDAAPTRCIDGRILAGWDDDEQLQRRHLAPKSSLLFEEDIRYVIARFKEIGIGFGGHIDDHQTGSNTGCGAVDNINLILDRLQRAEHQEQLRGLANLILGDAYDGLYIVNEVIGRMLYLDALKPTYMPREGGDPTGEFLYKKTVVSTIRQEADKSLDSVPSLCGPHNEVALVLNYVQGTTIDTDHFSHDNQNQLQLFAWDVWHMYEEARRLYPYDMHDKVEIQRAAVDKRMKYLTTRTLLGIATLMVLTDGSLRLVATTPR